VTQENTAGMAGEFARSFKETGWGAEPEGGWRPAGKKKEKHTKLGDFERGLARSEKKAYRKGESVGD